MHDSCMEYLYFLDVWVDKNLTAVMLFRDYCVDSCGVLNFYGVSS